MPSCSENGNSAPCSAAYWQAALHVVQKRSQALFDALVKRAVERQVQKRCLARHALQAQHDVGVLVHRRHRHNAVGPLARLHCLRVPIPRVRAYKLTQRVGCNLAKLRMVRRIGGHITQRVSHLLHHADKPNLYHGLPENPEISATVKFWKGIWKPLAAVGFAATFAASIFHYVGVGPNRADEEENNLHEEKDEERK